MDWNPFCLEWSTSTPETSGDLPGPVRRQSEVWKDLERWADFREERGRRSRRGGSKQVEATLNRVSPNFRNHRPGRVAAGSECIEWLGVLGTEETLIAFWVLVLI